MLEVLQIIDGVLVILLAIAIIVAILFQQGRRAGINGVISGGADTFLSKNKARTIDAKLPRWTRYMAIAFMVLVLLAGVIQFFINKG